MNNQSSRIILLSGSPLQESLDWSERSLTSKLLPPFLEESSVETTPECKDDLPAWRSLDLEAGPAFFNANNRAAWSQGSSTAGFTAYQPKVLSQYYEQSFTAHEDIQSSEILERETIDDTGDETSFLTALDTTTFESDMSIFSSQKQLVHARLHSASPCNLSEIPSATYLNSIVPQTMTTNLVVGIISISQPRTIITRKGNRVVELIELIVGDDTRAGFGINIWMPPALLDVPHRARTVDSSITRDKILRLRPRDVILAKRIALSSFRSKVYGQSLRRSMTTVDLLYRNTVDMNDMRGAFRAKEIEANIEGSGQLERVKRVKDWVQRFVGSAAIRETPSTKENARTHTNKPNLPLLPPDTPILQNRKHS